MKGIIKTSLKRRGKILRKKTHKEIKSTIRIMLKEENKKNKEEREREKSQ